jgi:hypothetical protein
MTNIVFSQTQDYIEISRKFVEAAKFQDDSAAYFKSVIAYANETELIKQLENDTYKKVFFINLYNAFTTVELKKNPDKYKNRNQFFKSKQFVVAGHNLSLDNIEHGFLRKSSIKWSLGKLQKLFPCKLEKKFRVDKVDYRIHFSLNCGARSCPPILSYNVDDLEEQLNVATENYIKSDASYDKEKNTLTLPILMSWFRGDFGNRKGILKICKDFKVIPENANPKFKYTKYDWSLYLDNYKY